MVRINTVDENGEEVERDLPEELFDAGDYKQIIHEHAEKAEHHRKLAEAWGERLRERYGVDVPELDQL